MTDRELLELAAKAAHLKDAKWDEFYPAIVFTTDTGLKECPWNPLRNDGEAFRLAVQLRISISSNIIRIETSTIQLTLDRTFIHESTMTQDNDVATRRAIVRAAAEIGRKMP